MTFAQLRAIYRVAVLVVLALATPLRAVADSDGYYCVGPHYFAYQFGFAAPPIGPNRLYVISLDSERISAPAVLDLPQFQNHGILCEDQAVKLAAYDAIYTVHLNAGFQPTGYEVTPWADHQHTPPEFVGRWLNLGGWARPEHGFQRQLVGTVNGGNIRYYLVIRETQVSQCQWRIESRLVRTDRNDRELQNSEIFNAISQRACEVRD